MRSPLMSPVSAAVKSGTGCREAVASHGSGPASTPSIKRRIGGRARERSNLVERRRKCEQAVARDAAVGRLEADDAAERRRLTDRSAGIGSERDRGAPRCDGRRGTAARAAGRAIGRPGVPHGAERRVLVGRAHRELVAVRLADDHGAGRLEPLTTVASYGGTNESRIRDEAVVRMPRTQRLSLSATGTPASGPSGGAAGARAVDVGGARQRAFGGDVVERVQRRD